MKVTTEKRCGCRDEKGRQPGKACPRLRRRGHGTWTYRVWVPAELVPLVGKQTVRSSGHVTQREAQAAGERLVQRLRAGEHVAAGAQTVGAFLEDWLETKRQLRPTTRRSYQGHLRQHLIPHLGAITLDRLQPSHITAAYDAIVAADPKRPVGPTTVARIHATLRCALNAAVKQRKLPFNPAVHVELPAASRPKVAPWSAEEVGAFLDAAASDRLAALYELAALHGLRRGELCGCRWPDLDDERAVLTIGIQIVDNGGRLLVGPPKSKAGEDRKVDLDSGTLGSLMAHRLRQDEERAAWGTAYVDAPTLPNERGEPVELVGLMFTREDGQPLRPEYVTRHMQLIAKKAGLPRKRLHDLRHGSASIQLAAGVALAIVSKRLGHSSITITADTYSHLLEGVGRQAAEAAAAMVPRAPRSPDLPTSCPQEPTEAASEAAGGAYSQFRTGAPPGTRTPNPRIKSPLLCQLS